MSVSKWSEYFSPTTQTWGNYSIKPAAQENFEARVKAAMIRSEQINPFLPNIEIGNEFITSKMLVKSEKFGYQA